MKRSSDTFVFTPEMGARLRAMRERAGLSQGQLMLLAGRLGKGAGMVASRLERGKIPYPSLGLVVDYLRACRAGFGQLADLLGPATSKPVPSERPEERSKRLGSFVASVAAGASVEAALAGLLDSHGWNLSPRQRRALLSTMRRTWRLAVQWPRNWRRILARNMSRPVREAGRVVVPAAFVEVVGVELWDLIEGSGPAPGNAASAAP
jgi:transcriptional regulator with XRE-family HTH domain